MEFYSKNIVNSSDGIHQRFFFFQNAEQQEDCCASIGRWRSTHIALLCVWNSLSYSRSCLESVRLSRTPVYYYIPVLSFLITIEKVQSSFREGRKIIKINKIYASFFAPFSCARNWVGWFEDMSFLVPDPKRAFFDIYCVHIVIWFERLPKMHSFSLCFLRFQLSNLNIGCIFCKSEILYLNSMPNSQFRWICLVFLVIISRIPFLLLLNLLTSSSKSSIVDCTQSIHKRCSKLCTTKIYIFFSNFYWKYWLPSQKYLQAVNLERERERKLDS